jgi:hypothetical protein
MTVHRTLNIRGLGGNYTTWHLWNEMLNAGATVVASGSGTGGVYDTADVFDHAINPVQNTLITSIGVGSGDENWGGPRCWILIEFADGSQLVIQRDNAAGDSHDDEWAYAYSPGGNFALGAADATVAATAADQENLWGTINATWTAIHTAGGTSNLIHVAADDALSPAGFNGVCMLELNASEVIKSCFIIDDLREVPTGGLFAAHAKTFRVASTNPLVYTVIQSAGFKAMIDYGGGSEVFTTCDYYPYRNATLYLYPLEAGAPSGGEVPMPILVGNTVIGGFLGVSRWLQWPALDRDYNGRSTDELMWYVDDVLVQDLPDGTTIPATV